MSTWRIDKALLALAGTLALTVPLQAGELDKEFAAKGNPVVAAVAASSSVALLSDAKASELDAEAPAQAYRRWGFAVGGNGWAVGYRSGWGGGYGYAGYRGGWGRGYYGGYRGGWGGYGYGGYGYGGYGYVGYGYPVYAYSSYYPVYSYSSYGCGCGW